MKTIRRYHTPVAVVAAVAGPLTLGAFLVPFRDTFVNTAGALSMVAVIAAVAAMGNRVAGLVASASAAMWFDYFLTRPYFRLTITHRADLETTISLFVVGVVICEIAARSRHHWRVSNEAIGFVTKIHDVAELAAGAAPISTIVDQASTSLVEILSLRACRFESSLVDPPLAIIEANGRVVHVGLDWPARDIGIPGPEAEIIAEWKGTVVGRFVITPTPGRAVTFERRVVALSLVAIVAAGVWDCQHAS